MSEHNGRRDVLWINTLKGACILLVVLHHVIITTLEPSMLYLSSGGWVAKIWHYFNQIISPLRMPAFFFVSGLLAINAINKKSWSDIFTKKIGNLFYLYLLWGVLQWIFIKGIITKFAHQQLSDSVNSAYSDSMVDFLFNLVTAMTSLWYLYALAGYFFISKVFKKYKGLVLIVAIVLNYLSVFGVFSGWGVTSLAQNIIFFVLGVFYSGAIIQLAKFNMRNFVLWLIVTLFAVLNMYFGFYKNVFMSVIAIIFAIIICELFNSLFNMSWLNWIGRNTLQIYVIHRVFIEALGLGVLFLGVNLHFFDYKAFSFLYSLLFPFFAVSICTIASIFTWKALNKGVGKSLFIYPALIHKKND